MTTADIWIALPLMLLAAGALLTLLVGAVTRDDTAATMIAVAVTLGAACWLIQSPPALVAPSLGLSAGGLARLFGISLALLSAAVLCLSSGYNRSRGIVGEEYQATMLFTTFGMLALTAATNLLTLFLGLEAMSFGFYILVAVDLQRAASGETALKYLLPGALGTAFMAFGLSLLYCAAGTLSLHDVMSLTLVSGAHNTIALAGWGCLLAGIAFKLSLAPAHLWTPDVYQGAPAPVVAFLSGGSKMAAILLLLLLLPQADDLAVLRIPLRGLALMSMIVGNLAALLQPNIRRMLAYSSIAQMGYVVLALLSARGGGYQAAAFYALAYGVISLAAFGAVAVIERCGSGETLDDYCGLGKIHPFASGVLTIALLALAGIPPTIGFTGKFLIFTAALRSGETALAVAGILLAAVSVYYYLNVIVRLYFKQAELREVPATTRLEYIVLAAAAGVIILMGLLPGTLIGVLTTLLP